MIFIFLSILVITIAVVTFFYTAPQIGASPSGERLARMKNASNYEYPIFINTIETKMEMPKGTLWKVLKHYLFENKKEKNPRVPIHVREFDNKHFENIADDSTAFVWFGHSSILIRTDGVTLLTDPVLVGKRASMFAFMGPKRFDYRHYPKIEDLPKIDAVLLSHDHYDHLDYPTIKGLKEKVDRFLVPLGVGAHLEKWGITPEQITELNWWDEVDLNSLKLALTPSRHFSGRGLRDRFHTLWGSWVIMSSSTKLYFSGDSGYFPGFKEIGEKYGPFDLTFMECGAYNEGWSEIHMFPEETAQAHQDVNGKLLLPIHWGKFDLSLHPWQESVERLAKKADEIDIQLFTPEIGQTVSIADRKKLSSWWKDYK
ncbi:MAG: MBL fold metallo-hydrolase [Bacteroidota bacterium]